jgi:hypothetical protein
VLGGIFVRYLVLQKKGLLKPPSKEARGGGFGVPVWVVCGMASLLFLFLMSGSAWYTAQYTVAMPVSAFTLSFLFSIFYFYRAELKTKEFHLWLKEHWDEISRDGVRLNGTLITPRTQFVQYQACISVLVYSFKLSSEWFVSEQDEIVPKTICTTLSMLFGWWGFPTGPIWTCQSIFANLRGGSTMNAQELVDQREITDTDFGAA